MQIEIKANFKPVESSNFHYGNMESRYGVNTIYFTKDGKPFVPIAGEFHFSRYPHTFWRKELLKMRDCGINVVSTYVFWNFHEEEKGKFQFEGDNNIAGFLALCRELSMPCILRIGPWCHGEVLRGGFPKRINKMPRKRSNNEVYLREVEDFFRGLYNEVKPYLDGETVIGIQLENEYTGSTEHIRTLRRIAEKIGFKTPFFTMTLWPSNRPDDEFLPMAGGYPDAPWARGKKRLAPDNRFAITPGRSESDIGEDLLKTKKAKRGAFSKVPYASCETGPGNQVSQHRRPCISEKDGYGVGFAKFASGVNWLGYYMFHGGRNPSDRPMQETRKTGYPNNYPIVDYDFQAPLSRYGECRAHGDRLRLMHTFIQSFDPQIAEKQPFFPKWKSADPYDVSFLKCSVRMDEQMSGYFFAGNYERGLARPDYEQVCVTVQSGGKTLCLPEITVKADEMFFYPFNLTVAGTKLDYVLAQPIAKTENDGKQTLFFVECPGISPRFSVDGCVTELSVDAPYVFKGKDGEAEILVLSEARAKQFHLINGKPVFAVGTVYSDKTTVYCETTQGFLGEQAVSEQKLDDYFTLSPCARRSLPFNSYLYSAGKRHFYRLQIDSKVFSQAEDVQLEFDFTGLNLQVFCGKKLLNDYFNTDGIFVMRLGEYKDVLTKNPELVIRAVPATRFGIGHVYSEIPMPPGKVELRLRRAAGVQTICAEI